MKARKLNELEQAIVDNRLFDVYCNGKKVASHTWYKAQEIIQRIMSDDYTAECWTIMV